MSDMSESVDGRELRDIFDQKGLLRPFVRFVMLHADVVCQLMTEHNKPKGSALYNIRIVIQRVA